MTSRVHRTQSVSAVFYPFFYHLPSVKRHCELRVPKNECVQQWNLFKCQTSTFYFSTYCPNLFEHFLIYAGQTVWETRPTAIAGSVVETTHRPGLFSLTTLSRPRSQANFLHRTCIVGLVKHLSPYTGRISEWMVFGPRLFAQRKWITERCSLWDAFSGSVAIFIVDNDVAVASS